MKSFIDKTTGVTLTPRDSWVEEQLLKDSRYEVVGAKASNKSNKNDDKGAKASNGSTENTKAIEDYTKKELVAVLKSLGIEDVNEDMKKEDLLAVVPEDYKAE